MMGTWEVEWADGFNTWWAAGSRAAVTAAGNLARLTAGKPPLPPPPREGASPREVLETRRGAKLLLYRAPGDRPGLPIVVVASLINRHYVFDLLPGLSVFEHLNRAGFDLHVLDWGPPGEEGPGRTFADYVDDLVPWALRVASQRSGCARVPTLGYCLGGTLAAMHAARHPEQVGALVLLGAPIDFHQSGVMARFTDRRWFDADVLADAFGNIPPLLLQSAFKAMAAQNPWAKYGDLLSRGGDDDAVRHFVALESWLEDNVSFPGGVYRQYIRDCYQENLLVQGKMCVGGSPVDLGRIDMPVLDVVATRDHIAAPPSSRALLDVVSSTDKRVLEFDTGHIGLTTSRRALRELWPQVSAWLAQRAVAPQQVAPRRKRSRDVH
jgi:polyhydroxyalkanoate synthase